MTKTFLATCALVGTIIGAGFLAIPYTVMRSGFLPGLITIIVVGIAMALTMLYLGEIVLRTNGYHQLTSYASRYLGKRGKQLMAFAMLIGIYGALVAYFMAEGQSLSVLITGTTDNALVFGLAFWLVLTFLTRQGINALKKAEPIGVILAIILVISLVLFTASKIDFTNLTYINTSNLLVPWGIVIFAFIAYSVVPELKRLLNNDGQSMKRAIINSYVIASLIYIIFTAIVLGYKGQATPQLATIALGAPFILLGIITMTTASLALSIALTDLFHQDYHFSKNRAWLATTLVPMILYVILVLTKSAGFSTILSITGIITGGLSFVLILAMVGNAKRYGDRIPEYSMPLSRTLRIILTFIILAGAIANLIKL